MGWWVIGGFFPLHKPSASAEDIQAFFSHDVVTIRLGMVIVMWSAAVFIPFTSTIADFVARFEGRNGPLTRTMTMAGYANAMLTFYPPLWWIVSTWRVDERSADTTRLLNDIGWLQFIGGIPMMMPMFAVLAVVAFNDKSGKPNFPRWFGYQSIMTFMLFLPDQLLFFFKTGPFAWNGVLGFWVPLAVFCGWFISIFVLMRRALVAEGRISGSEHAVLPVG
ncbi:hypothetical protein [Mycobacterium antarcticum]|uniref:hypothetical protein n=1 Tax=Mycolicibacterium sp. TUM20985 TaxID=3023370 RepID=UPI002573E9EF|nr:hypothetical protein [Mycolicibacterium sp. TUM20985]